MAIRYLSGINVDSNTLFVDSTNNKVGIGTASPATKLDVSGEIRSTDSGGYAALLAVTSLGYSILADTHVGGAMTIFTAGTEKMRVTSAGYLLVGATSIGQARGGTTTKQLIKLGASQYYLEVQAADTSSSAGLLFSDGNSGNYGLVDYTSTDAMLFYTASGERMRITSDGTLQVGTTSQTYNNATYGYVASFKGAVTTQAYISVALSNQASTSEGMLFE